MWDSNLGPLCSVPVSKKGVCVRLVASKHESRVDAELMYTPKTGIHDYSQIRFEVFGPVKLDL